MSHPSLYRAKAVSIKDGVIEAFVPQVFGESTVFITDLLGVAPIGQQMGWVFFQAGNCEFPVWMSPSAEPASLPIDMVALWEEADTRYVNASGDVMTGSLVVDGVLDFTSIGPTGLAYLDERYEEFTYTHTQPGAATVWTINHSLGGYPNVTIVETATGDVIEGDVEYMSSSQVTITFAVAVSGVAYLS